MSGTPHRLERKRTKNVKRKPLQLNAKSFVVNNSSSEKNKSLSVRRGKNNEMKRKNFKLNCRQKNKNLSRRLLRNKLSKLLQLLQSQKLPKAKLLLLRLSRNLFQLDLQNQNAKRKSENLARRRNLFVLFTKPK